MRCLVTGANGMLGSALCPLLSQKGHEVVKTDISLHQPDVLFLDVKNLNGVKKIVKEEKPDIIFHLSAETDVDRCEKEEEHAFLTNTEGTKNIALVCRDLDITMVYISTCGVFDGKKKEPYSEVDIPRPVSIYAKSKHEGEKAVRKLLKKYFIFRAGWMIGGGKKDKKFVAKIVELIKTKDVLTVVNDKRGCPTFTKDFSQAIIQIIKSDKFGLYHVTNSGWATRYDIACKITEFLGRGDIIVKPISSDLFPLPAPRPDSEVVDNKGIKSLGIEMRPWQDALKEYLVELTEGV